MEQIAIVFRDVGSDEFPGRNQCIRFAISCQELRFTLRTVVLSRHYIEKIASL